MKVYKQNAGYCSGCGSNNVKVAVYELGEKNDAGHLRISFCRHCIQKGINKFKGAGPGISKLDRLIDRKRMEEAVRRG